MKKQSNYVDELEQRLNKKAEEINPYFPKGSAHRYNMKTEVGRAYEVVKDGIEKLSEVKNV